MEKMQFMKRDATRNRIASPSLSKDFTIIAMLFALSIVVTLTWLGWSIYTNQQTDRLYSYSAEGDRLDTTLRESFDYVTYYAKFLGEKIIEHGDTDDEYIAKLFFTRGQVNPEEQKLYSWSKFDWINPEKRMTVSTQHGVLKDKVDMSMRSYLNETPLFPGKLRFSDPAIGIPSGQWIIPTGVGITDSNGRFYGTVGTGFSIERLKEKLEQSSAVAGFSFIVFNRDHQYVIQSSGSKCTKDAFRTITNQTTDALRYNDAGFLQKSIKCANINYFFYRAATNYPFYFLIGEDVSAAEEKLKNIVYPRAIEFFAIWAVGVALLYFFQYRLIRPIITISNVAKKIALGEHVDVPQGHYPEINVLAEQLENIQQIRENLKEAKEDAEEAHAQVKQANESLEMRVQERTAKLEEALAVKSEFLKNMSHEVRSPIQGILAFSETLAKDWHKLPEEIRYERAVHIGDNSNRLLSLVTNLLDLSQLEKGRMSFNMTAHNNLSVVVEEIIKECQPFLAQKDIEIDFIPPACKTIATFDTTRITQLVRNLVINAIKFTEKGKIIISITQLIAKGKNGLLSPCLELTVKDEGIGIPESEREMIFDQFNQSSRTKTRAGGTGLGLSIAKQIIEAHNGIIWAENNTHKGAAFTFRLPIVDGEIKEIDITDKQKQPESSIKEAHIVAIDDEKNCLAAITMYLETDGHKVTTAIGGIEGLNTIKTSEGTIDLILLDLMMPDLYGLDLLEELKSIPHLSHIPVVLQTGSSDHAEIEKGLALGAIGILPKPYNRAKLKSLIAQVLQQNKTL